MGVLLCDPQISSLLPKFQHRFPQSDFWDEYLESSLMKEVFEMAPMIEDTLVFCKFRDEFFKCDKLFTPLLTRNGVCYSFNILSNQDLVSDL